MDVVDPSKSPSSGAMKRNLPPSSDSDAPTPSKRLKLVTTPASTLVSPPSALSTPAPVQGSPSTTSPTPEQVIAKAEVTAAEALAIKREQRKLKKKVKKAAKAEEKLRRKIAEVPSHERVFGKNAQPELHVKFKKTKVDLRIRDLQMLALWTLTTDSTNPNSWVFVKNKPLCNRVVAVVLDSLSVDLYEYGKEKGLFPNLQKLFVDHEFGHEVPTRAPGSKNKIFHGLPVLLNVPLKKSTLAVAAENLPPLSHYILADHQLTENLYPRLGADASAGFINIATDSTAKETMLYSSLAIDCEMCMTAKGLALGRVSVCDANQKVVYDKYVKIEEPITDYLTRYSGITPQHLEGVTLTLAAVQTHLLSIISPETILIGHSLENDLIALKMIHDRVVDTAILFPNAMEGRKNGLKFLANKYLRSTIQTGNHDSVQDAIAALQLALLKQSKGPEFGQPNADSESIFLRLAANSPPVSSIIIDNAFLCSRFIQNTAADCVPVEEDAKGTAQLIKMNKVAKEIQAAASSSLTASESLNLKERARGVKGFSVLHLHGIERHLGGSEKAEPFWDGIDAVLTRMDSAVGEIFESLPYNTLLMVTGGNGDLPLVKRLQSQKNMASRSTLSVWTPEQEEQLTTILEAARRTMSWVRIKTDPLRSATHLQKKKKEENRMDVDEVAQ